MSQHINYFAKKEQNCAKAKAQVEYMEYLCPRRIQESVEKTKIYTGNAEFSPRTAKGSVVFEAMDTVSAVFKYADLRKKEAVLNFASYKEPGGMFLKGSMAQEEALCHESDLYNVISQFEEEYYSENRKRLNRAMYYNRALYSPGIFFQRNDVQAEALHQAECDVITCAAPNYATASKYCGLAEGENETYLIRRCTFVLEVAAANLVDTLILGAFGCGVFGQSAYHVGQIFGKLLKTSFAGQFETVVFACLPGSNYDDLVRGVQDAMA